MRNQLLPHKINHFLIVLFSSVCWISGYEANAQLTYRVLFLGNSYTAVNNLPQLVHDAAASAGDNLVFDINAPGGYRLGDHYLDVTSNTKIMAGGWDYVVIQGQSQEPVTLSGQFSSGGHGLNTLIKQYNPCAITMPYMTWGRKNGDASTCGSYPVMCTYLGMDTTLKKRYLDLTALINGEVSPVSIVWRYLRQNHPSIELYQADESHPSLAGSYAAACCFYASIFKKDPALITFDPGLSAGDAAIIRNAVKTQVFNTLPKWNYKKLPVSDFAYAIGPGNNQVNFNPLNKGVQQTYLWNFGDGTTTPTIVPTHTYAANGTYTVTLTTTTCDQQGLHTSVTDTVIQFCSHTPTVYITKPWFCSSDTLWTQAADSYQWYNYSVPLPETKQYLANPAKYNLTGFCVVSTVNGCSELSTLFTKTATWSGYYFDLLGDPCKGDTVAFAVLHTNGSLSGSEKILWYKNDVLLQAMTDGDTLLISSSGKYECKVVNPNSNCPLDTTWYSIKYDCGETTVGLAKRERELSWTLFPNPASESITIRPARSPLPETLQIYNATGILIKMVDVQGTTTLSIADLPKGLYFVRSRNSEMPPLKFIRQ